MLAKEKQLITVFATRDSPKQGASRAECTEATARDYATAAEYNKPLLSGEYIREDRHEAQTDRAKHYYNFVF